MKRIIWGLLAITGWGWWIVTQPPENIWIEMGGLILLGAAVFLISWGISGRKKWGGLITAGVVGFLLLARWGALDVLTGLLFFLVLLVIGLMG